VRSSTSSFERPVPQGRWVPVFVGALAVCLLFIAVMELRLAIRGFHATASDSETSWLIQRKRASALGEQALILAGSSRMLLDIDLDVLRERSGLEPVQLAIDGTSFIPILENLAADPTVRGTVLVSYEDMMIAGHEGDKAAHAYLKAWTRAVEAHHVPDFALTEGLLTDWLHAHLRSYADGARPMTTLRIRLLARQPTPQYLYTLAGRSRLADYTKVPMPEFYYGRVQRALGRDVAVRAGMTWSDLDAEIRRQIVAMPAADATLFDERLRSIATLVEQIESRGGRVAFVALPMDGLMRLIDDARYPRERFWNRFVQDVKVAAIQTRDDPSLAGFRCPDGSHLDYRDRGRFTAALAGVLGLGNPASR